jgi:hypothetical protein
LLGAGPFSALQTGVRRELAPALAAGPSSVVGPDHQRISVPLLSREKSGTIGTDGNLSGSQSTRSDPVSRLLEHEAETGMNGLENRWP